jgi:hypothetical protein
MDNVRIFRGSSNFHYHSRHTGLMRLIHLQRNILHRNSSVDITQELQNSKMKKLYSLLTLFPCF